MNSPAEAEAVVDAVTMLLLVLAVRGWLLFFLLLALVVAPPKVEPQRIADVGANWIRVCVHVVIPCNEEQHYLFARQALDGEVVGKTTRSRLCCCS